MKFLEIYGDIQNTLGKKFRIKFVKLDMWHVVQICFWEEAQNNNLGESYHLEIKILVRPSKGRSSEKTS
jgi:hypothetical protein